MAKVFLDTNVLVYGVDEDEPRKRDISRAIQLEITVHNRPAISTQVMQEFYSTVITKQKLSPVQAKEIIKSWSDIEMIVNTPQIIEDAIDISILNRISFWDGLILAAASFARCEKVLTEDMKHGQTIRGVLIENPFRD